MSTATTDLRSPKVENLADLLDRLGNVPLERVRFRPFPGTATEKDVIAAHAADKSLCELLDGVLVDKAMGTRESLLAVLIGHYFWDYLEEHDLGIALGADGMLRLWPGRVRIPDVAFISWDRMPEGKLPDQPIADLAADLAVEVLSENNTDEEIERKLEDYFKSGTRLVWVIDPETQSADVYRSPTDRRKVAKNQSLDGEDVLLGFSLSLRTLFARSKKKSWTCEAVLALR